MKFSIAIIFLLNRDYWDVGSSCRVQQVVCWDLKYFRWNACGVKPGSINAVCCSVGIPTAPLQEWLQPSANRTPIGQPKKSLVPEIRPKALSLQAQKAVAYSLHDPCSLYLCSTGILFLFVVYDILIFFMYNKTKSGLFNKRKEVKRQKT